MKKKGPVRWRGLVIHLVEHLPTPLRDIRSRLSRRAGRFPIAKPDDEYAEVASAFSPTSGPRPAIFIFR